MNTEDKRPSAHMQSIINNWLHTALSVRPYDGACECVCVYVPFIK